MNAADISDDEAHIDALKEIERLWGAPLDSADGRRLNQLVEAVAAYEERRWPIANGA